MIRVARVQRKSGGNRRRSDQKIHGSAATRFATGSDDRCVDAAVRACDACVYGQWLECRLRSLQTILALGAFGEIGGGMRTGSKLGECDGRDRDFDWQTAQIDRRQVDDDGRVDQPARHSRLSHVVSRPDRSTRRHPSESGGERSAALQRKRPGRSRKRRRRADEGDSTHRRALHSGSRGTLSLCRGPS